jgi:iron complex outermembrane receptor protein
LTAFILACGPDWVDRRAYADLSRLPATRGVGWARGPRVALQVLNLFDRRQSVRDATDVTPLAFAPGYLDPAGLSVGSLSANPTE